MIVVVPTQHLNVMQAWDGFLGIVARLPILKLLLGLVIGLWRLRRNDYMAWPNITAKKLVVPERIGKITPLEIAYEASYLLRSKSMLANQKKELMYLRGNTGAVEQLTKEIINLLYKVKGM